MARITAFKAWADPGFTDGSVEVPKLADCGLVAKLPTPDYTMPDSAFPVRPPKGRFFSELVIHGDYEVFHRYNYLMITVTYDNASSSVTSFDYFGWIDRVSILKDGEDFQQISIEWHVDLWRTYGGMASFGSGIVKNKPHSGSLSYKKIPLQTMPFIFVQADSIGDFNGPQTIMYNSVNCKIYWMLVVYVSEHNDVSKQSYYLMPVLINPDGTPTRTGTSHVIIDNHTATHITPDLSDMLDTFSYRTGISATKIAGSYLLPECPMDAGVSVVSGDLVVTMTDASDHGCPTDSYDDSIAVNKWFSPALSDPVLFRTEDNFLPGFATSEIVRTSVRDSHGLDVYSIPPRFVSKKITRFYEISASSVKHCIAFHPEGTTEYSIQELRAMGLVADIPCCRMSLASNSYSDYVASGQRDFEAEQRRLAAEMGAANGTASSLSSGITKGRMSMLSGLTNTASSYLINRYYDSGIQENLDTAHAMQFDTIAYPGDDFQWLRNCVCDTFVRTTPDQYSIDRFNQWIAMNGLEVNEPTLSCDVMCKTYTGSLRIEDLVVLGGIPSEAKEYIKQRFARGVRMKSSPYPVAGSSNE